MLEKLPESVGQILVHQRAGMENVVYNQLYRQRRVGRLDLRSNEFVVNGQLPTRFTADGEGVSPPLRWSEVPEEADSPTLHPWVHAIVVNLAAADGSVEEGALERARPQAVDERMESGIGFAAVTGTV